MPFTIERDGEHELVRVVCTGTMTSDDFMAAMEALAPDGTFTDALRLWDLRACRVDVTLIEMRHGAHVMKERDAVSTRIALLVERDVTFGLGRAFGVFRESDQAAQRVFREESEALAWLLGD